MKALLTLILQYVHVKRNVFTLYQEEYFLYVFMGVFIVTLKLSCEDIPGSMISKANESWFKLPNKKCELKFWLNRGGLRWTSSQVIFFIYNILFHFFYAGLVGYLELLIKANWKDFSCCYSDPFKMYDNTISIKSLCFSSSASYAIMIGFRVRKK